MKTISDVSRFSSRLLIFSILLSVPFLRMLLQEDYGFLYFEVAVSVGLIISVAALLAAIARNYFVFNCLLLVLTVLLSVNAIRADFLPDARWRLPISICIVVVAVAMWLLRTNFYVIFAAFILGSFAIDIGKSLVTHGEHPATAHARTAGKLNHVVHIILDEMIGLGAMPPECDECVRAGNMFRNVLEAGNFQIYPNAFSNYRSTRDSIPSILNGRLVKRATEFFSSDSNRILLHLGERAQGARRPFLHENRYFDSYLAKGWTIRAYQSDYILYSSPEYPSVRERTYRANSLRALHSISLPWTARMRQLFVIYLRSDRFWWENWMRYFPASLQVDKLDVGPISLQNTWPDRIVEDFRIATQSTLFLVHLLTPHYPYVFEPDGRLSDWHDWSSHRVLDFNENEQTEYEKRYRLYCRQVQFLARQIDTFLKELKTTGIYDLTTVIIHGDHGSRLRLFTKQHQQWRTALFHSDPNGRQHDRYDYPPGEPDYRDLLNQFATLLAIKLPGAVSPRVVNTPGSVLYYLQKVVGTPDGSIEKPDSLNAVYLFDRSGLPVQINMLRAFVSASKNITFLPTEGTK